MKERIKKIFIALALLLGIGCIGALICAFLPLWLRCVIWGVMVVWLLYDISKPEKEDLHKKVERLNDLDILRKWIGGKMGYDDLKIKIMDEQERIVNSIDIDKDKGE